MKRNWSLLSFKMMFTVLCVFIENCKHKTITDINTIYDNYTTIPGNCELPVGTYAVFVTGSVHFKDDWNDTILNYVFDDKDAHLCYRQDSGFIYSDTKYMKIFRHDTCMINDSLCCTLPNCGNTYNGLCPHSFRVKCIPDSTLSLQANPGDFYTLINDAADSINNYAFIDFITGRYNSATKELKGTFSGQIHFDAHVPPPYDGHRYTYIYGKCTVKYLGPF